MLIAHGPAGSHGVDQAWFTEPISALVLFTVGILYVAGWRRAVAAGSPPDLSRAGWFGLGWAVLAVALVSPVHSAGESVLSLHMLQHSLLILAPAALTTGRAGTRIVQGLPTAMRGRVIRPVRPLRSLRPPMWAVTTLLVAMVLFWHVPAVFEVAARVPLAHAAEHASLILVALVYWKRVVGPRSTREGAGAPLVSLFALAVLGAGLGALLTFATVPWYPQTAARSTAAGIDWLADQQLAGVAMTVPMGAVLMGVAARLGWRWAGGADRWSQAPTVQAEMSTSAATNPNRSAR